MFEEIRLLSQRVSIRLPARRKATGRTVWSISSALFALPIIESVREVYPETAISPQDAPDLIEDVQQMAHKLIRMILVAKLALPPIGPSDTGTITPLKVERR
jgi:hypothetical protein